MADSKAVKVHFVDRRMTDNQKIKGHHFEELTEEKQDMLWIRKAVINCRSVFHVQKFSDHNSVLPKQ